MSITQRITICLWFDDQAEEAVEFYSSIFRNSKVTNMARYSEAGIEIHGKPVGSVQAIAFELDGQSFTAINGGPMFKFNEAVSLEINCANQDEIDYYWEKLTEGGDPDAQQCGWLKDKFGVSWQVIPPGMYEMLNNPDSEKAERAMNAMLQMKKLDIAELERAAEG